VRVGVLALQGDWHAHQQALAEVGTRSTPVRTAAELAGVDALVLPGGESTTMLRLLAADGLGDALAARLAAGLPTLGTCAGLILLARRVQPEQQCLGVLDVDVVRNAYGRQVHSRVAAIELDPSLGAPPAMEGVFIRAPRVGRAGAAVEVLGRVGDDPVLVRQGRVVAATFHPELSADRRVHRLLLGLAEGHDA
jgi:5'-phosphate synthase pdxT subunit